MELQRLFKICLLQISILIFGCESTGPVRELTRLEACNSEILNRWRTCSLLAYGGTSSLGSPVIAPRLQVCEDRRFEQEDRCMRLYSDRVYKYEAQDGLKTHKTPDAGF